MTPDPAAIAADLTTVDDTSELSRLVDQRFDDGDLRFLTDLGIELWRRYGSEPFPPWQFSVFDTILRRFALRPGPVTETAGFLTTVARGRRARYVASLLATDHSASELRALVGNAELSACLSQELPLRAYVPGRMWARPPHPLSWLSLRLTPLEQWPEMPGHSLRGTSSHSSRVVTTPLPPGGPLPPWYEVTESGLVESGLNESGLTERRATESGVLESGHLTAAVRKWCTESNGRVEARVFLFDQPVTAAALINLGLASTEGLTDGFGECSVSAAWHQLFEAASMGGAYSRGEFGAYGRLAAWRSVAALTGAPPGATFREVVALAEAATWIWFGGATDWFEQVAWDLGVAALSPDGRRLAVLAATDTD